MILTVCMSPCIDVSVEVDTFNVGRTNIAKRKEISVAKANPVRKGAQARRQAAKKVREQRNEYFRQVAIDRAIERDREKQLRNQD